MSHHQQDQQDHGYNHDQILANLAHQHQIQRDNNNFKIFRAYEPTPPTTLVGLSQDPETMLSEMFSFGHHGFGSDWCGSTTRQVTASDSIVDHHSNNLTPHHDQITNINVHSAAAMQLFTANPPQRSPSPPPPLAPHPYWTSEINNLGQLHGVVGGQGLSLSLSSKQAEESGFFNILHQPVIHNLASVGPGLGLGSSSSTGQHQVHIGFGLRNSKYLKAAQELLEEFCSVGRSHLKKAKLSRQDSVNPDPSTSGPGGGSPRKDPPQLSASERIEHQRRKVKLVSMLDEVDRRYNYYCQQMQMVVNSFDQVMGFGAAMPYTGLAQKAMSRHFRCLKDAIQAQLRLSCESLGENDPTAQTGLTKGETPRLKLLEQSLRQQRSFQHNQMGLVMDQEAWRPQRGLPERSVNILRSWLFEHFLHPYPSDADKHTLARQTGLSRNQVSNWFINARVRLWKPMVEEMYQKESKDAQQEHEGEGLDEGESRGKETYPTNNYTNTTNNNNLGNNTTITQQQQQNSITFPPNSSSSSTCYSASTAHIPPLAATSTTVTGHGTSAGDVSLTLGLQHAGNTLDINASFSVRSFPG